MNVYNPNFKFKFQNKNSIRASNIVENGTTPPLIFTNKIFRAKFFWSNAAEYIVHPGGGRGIRRRGGRPSVSNNIITHRFT